MINNLKKLYYNNPVLFWVSALTSCLIFCYLITLFALNDGVNLSYHYHKFLSTNMYAFNLTMGRDVFAAFNNTDIREMHTFPAYAIISGLLAKYSGIDLILSGRLVSFLLFLGMLYIFFKFKEFLENYLLVFVLIYFLLANQIFVMVMHIFHPDILNYFLILLSLYLFYKNKLLGSYICIFALSIFKTPYAFALVTFLSFEYCFNNNLYKDNWFKVIIRERTKILMLLFLFVPVFATDFFRNYLLGDKIFSLSAETGVNSFFTDNVFLRGGLRYPLMVINVNNESLLLHSVLAAENLFFLIFPLCAIIAKDLRLFIKTTFIVLIFLFNLYAFMVLYASHGYSMLGLGFVFITVLMVSYKEVFTKIINKYLLVRNRFFIVTILFLPFFIFKLLTFYAFAMNNFSENKAITYARDFSDKNKNMLIVDSWLHLTQKRGVGLLNRQSYIVTTRRMNWDCDEFINSYDQIFLMLNGGCITELLLADGSLYLDIKNRRMSAFWVKDERLKKRKVTDKIEINNFYRDDTEFDIDKAKKEFTNIVYQEENIKLYRKDDEFFYIVENCISKNLVENNIRMLVYYDFIGYLKILLEDGYSSLDRRLPRQDINILGDSMIENDTCYGKKKLRHANNIKEIEYLPSKFYHEYIS